MAARQEQSWTRTESCSIVFLSTRRLGQCSWTRKRELPVTVSRMRPGARSKARADTVADEASGKMTGLTNKVGALAARIMQQSHIWGNEINHARETALLA